MDMYKIVKNNPLLAIMRNVPLEKTMDYTQAIVNGGISFFEVALNSNNGLEQITMLRKKFGNNCMIGAGTAITVERAKAALDAGAQFLLTPGTPLDVLEYCAINDIMLLPGVLTPSDVAICLEFGFKTMKLFPAGSMPFSYINDMKGPFDDTNYMAIGGITSNNIKEFYEAGYISAGLASNLMPKEYVIANDWERCAEYIKGLVNYIK